MEVTEQQIQERANQIGDRPYHPVTDDANSMYRTERSNGITIRFELMRTAMGGLLTRTPSHGSVLGILELNRIVSESGITADKMLLEMARQELGATE